MSSEKKGLLAAGAIVVVVVGLVLIAVSQVEVREHKLADGSILRLEKIAYGKRETIRPGGLVEQLKVRLPASWTSRLLAGKKGNQSSWWENTMMHSNENALYVYVTRRNTLLGGYQNVNVAFAKLVDADGCEFVETQGGGEDNGLLPKPAPGLSSPGMASSVNWFRFEAFPRRENKFKLRLFDQSQKLLTEFTVRNPAPPPPLTNWVVEPLPITRTNGDATFTLKEIKIDGAKPSRSWEWSPGGIVPKYEILENGLPSKNWKALDRGLYDSTGNFASEVRDDSRILCAREPAWKLRVKFFGSEEAQSASNAVWVLRGLAVPGPGKYIALKESHELQGVRLRVTSFAGPGEIYYENTEPTSAHPLDSPEKGSKINTSWQSGNTPNYRVQGRTPHLLVDVGELNDDQKLTIRATDDQGRQFYAYEWHEWFPSEPPKEKPDKIHYMEKRYSKQAPFYGLNLPADAKTVDISFCVHTCFAPEFIFKPPVEQNSR